MLYLKSQSGFIPLVALVIVGVVGTSGITVAASQSSIPGDALYPVKKVTEDVRVATAFSKKDKAKVHLDIAEEKVKEIEKLEKKGETEKITEASQNLEDSQDQALELTQDIKSEGENVDELVKRLEVQTKIQQTVFTRVSSKIPVQAGESLRKSLEDFRKELEVLVESVEEDEQENSEEEDTEQEDPDQKEADSNQTPCPSPNSSEDENNYQEEDEDTGTHDDEEEEGWKKYQYYEDEDVQGVSQLRNSQGSSYDSGAGSQTFDGGAGSGDFEDSTSPESPNDPCDTVYEEPTSSSPDVEGVSTTGGLLQLILNTLFHPQKR